MGDETPAQDGAITASVKVEDAVLEANVKVDVIAALKKEAEKSTNTIDDTLVKMLEMARGNLDWKGYAKTIL